MKVRKILVQILLIVLMAIQAFYVAFAEGFVLWLLQDLTTIGTDSGFWTLVLFCFVPNYIYTCNKTYRVMKDL